MERRNFYVGGVLQSIFFVLLLTLSQTLDERVSKPTVMVMDGRVVGTKEKLGDGREVFVFANIPYAQPPTGYLRFTEPQPKREWTGTWDASVDRGEFLQCIQYKHVPGGQSKILGQEDCLYLTIYTPWLPEVGVVKEKMDVIVFIHGGAFMYNSQHPYKPITLMQRHDIVFVKINYRLGPFGFLSTGDEFASGNFGLMDQALALRWIKNNIAQFGGNPNSVTIAGSSAGGASVHCHMLSPLSKGLFHRAISMSGTMMAPWAIAENLAAKTHLIATHVGCDKLVDRTDSKVLVNCLRKRTAVQIVEAVRKTQPFLYNPFAPWGPVVDKFAAKPVLPDYPARLIKDGKVAAVPWLNSVTTSEGLYPGAEFLRSEETMNEINSEWRGLSPFILDFNNTVSANDRDYVADKIKRHYMEDKPISIENYKPFIQMLGDRLFVVGAERASRIQARAGKGPVYFYEFNFLGRSSVSTYYSGSQNLLGVCHVDDLNYVVQFRMTLLKQTASAEQKMIDFINDLWVSFAKNGKPHLSSWDPVASNSFNYLRIDNSEGHELYLDKSKNLERHDLRYEMLYNVKELGQRLFWDKLPIHEKNN